MVLSYMAPMVLRQATDPLFSSRAKLIVHTVRFETLLLYWALASRRLFVDGSPVTLD